MWSCAAAFFDLLTRAVCERCLVIALYLGVICQSNRLESQCYGREETLELLKEKIDRVRDILYRDAKSRTDHCYHQLWPLLLVPCSWFWCLIIYWCSPGNEQVSDKTIQLCLWGWVCYWTVSVQSFQRNMYSPSTEKYMPSFSSKVWLFPALRQEVLAFLLILDLFLQEKFTAAFLFFFFFCHIFQSFNFDNLFLDFSGVETLTSGQYLSDLWVVLKQKLNTMKWLDHRNCCLMLTSTETWRSAQQQSPCFLMLKILNHWKACTDKQRSCTWSMTRDHDLKYSSF